MNMKTNRIGAAARLASLSMGGQRPRVLHTGLLLAMLSAPLASQAIDFGPNGMFSLNGFGQVTLGQHDNQCLSCQWVGPTEGKQKIWADALLPGQPIQNVTTIDYQVQPFLGVKFNLGKGFKLEGLLSQRWRDAVTDGDHLAFDNRYGSLEDVPGFWFDRNITLSHEDYGRLSIGSMLTRSWREADYPIGSNIGLSSPWASSGAGYGMLANAYRYQSRMIDFKGGDLFLEATYDTGDKAFTKNKPQFVELSAKYYRGPLQMDVILQDTKNGGPGAWGHSPFTGLTPFAVDDKYLTGSSQGIAMVMGTYQLNNKVELSGGVRRNWWSGANAVQNPETLQWNSMFNVDWNATLNGVQNPGYAASSYDLMWGARYHMGQWTPSIGFVHLGTAKTDNPSERGQSNAALFSVLGLQYDYGKGLKFDFQAGAVHYARLGLSPMSMPGNDSFSSVDSRISRDGTWLTAQMTYGF
jgi:hypothetical protein